MSGTIDLCSAYAEPPQFTFVIDLETPPSSPEIEAEESDDEVEEFELNAEPTPECTSMIMPPRQPTKLERLVDSLRNAKAHGLSANNQSALEQLIMDHLHTNPVTVADVELLIPAFNRRFSLTNKLAINIGLFHSRGHISASSLEAMQLHILAQGDPHNVVFTRVGEKLERFQREKTAREMTHMRSSKARRFYDRRQLNERETQLRRAEKEKRDVEQRLRSMPEEWHQPVENASFLPYGVNTTAELFAELVEVDYEGAMELQNLAEAWEKGRGKKKTLEKNIAQCCCDADDWRKVMQATEDALRENVPPAVCPQSVPSSSSSLFPPCEENARPKVNIPAPPRHNYHTLPPPPPNLCLLLLLLEQQKNRRQTKTVWPWPKTCGLSNHLFRQPRGEPVKVRLPPKPSTAATPPAASPGAGKLPVRHQLSPLIAVPRCFEKPPPPPR